MSRILVVWNSNNRVEHRDCDGVQKALEDQGHYVEQIRMSHMYKSMMKLTLIHLTVSCLNHGLMHDLDQVVMHGNSLS